MLFNKFLKERRSTREYTNKSVEKEKIERLMNYADRLEQSSEDIRFIFFEDGSRVFDKLEGKGGYSGVMIKAPHYIGLQLDNDNSKTVLKSAYEMETLLTKAYQMNLGTCWINIKDAPYDVKKELMQGQNKHMDYIIALGYSKNKGTLSKISTSDGLEKEDVGYLNTIRSFGEKKYYVEDSTSSRLSIEEIVFNGEFGKSIDTEELDRRGLDELFYYIRFAPSNMNKQPWRFILKNDKVLLSIIDPTNKNNMIDGGIMMYYFEEMAKSIGFKSVWQIWDGKIHTSDNVEYKILGEYKL